MQDSDYDPGEDPDASADENPPPSKTRKNSPKTKSKVRQDPTKTSKDPRLSTQKWVRCPHPELTDDELHRLSVVFNRDAILNLKRCKTFNTNKYPIRKYYCFAHRVCRGYKKLWQRDHDVKHLNRENTARAVIGQVYEHIKPWSDKPHFGNIHSGMVSLLPILVEVFKIPSDEYVKGSDEWFQIVKATDR